MSNEIYIKFMSDELLTSIKQNQEQVLMYMSNNKISNNWLENVYNGKQFVEKTYKIKDFELKLSLDGDYKKVDFENSITLYESLKSLPKYVLADERFWAWLNFDKCYEVSLEAMPINDSKSILNNHYLFGQGTRRGLFFGVMSRSFYRVALTVDDSLEDKYELTRFVVDNPQRFRELSWRAFSNRSDLVRGIVRAIKKATEEKPELIKSSYYKLVAKFVSRLGSIKLLDAFHSEDIYEYTYDYICNLIDEEKVNTNS